MTTTTECLFIIIESETQTINNFDLLSIDHSVVSVMSLFPHPLLLYMDEEV